jgi:hypothetical protein
MPDSELLSNLRDPYELLTREQFMIECLNTLEYAERYARKKQDSSVTYDLIVTQRYLKRLFLVEELMDFDWLTLISRDE